MLGLYPLLAIGACLVDANDDRFYAELRPVGERVDPIAVEIGWPTHAAVWRRSRGSSARGSQPRKSSPDSQPGWQRGSKDGGWPGIDRWLETTFERPPPSSLPAHGSRERGAQVTADRRRCSSHDGGVVRVRQVSEETWNGCLLGSEDARFGATCVLVSSQPGCGPPW